MLKGRLQIELKNEETGAVETIEQENMITNAVPKVLGLTANTASDVNSISSLIPIAKKALGGLLLFDGPIEEDPENYHFPMDVHLTGSSGRGTNTASKIMGSLNAAESMQLDNGYMSVWDFSTSQANGTIQSLALTNNVFAENPMFNTMYYSTSGYLNMSRTYAPIAYDSEKGVLYLYSEGKIYSKKLYSHIIRASTANYGGEMLVKDLAFSNPNYNYWSISNGYDGYLYAIYAPRHTQKETATFQIRKFRISDFSFEEEPEQRFSVDNLMPQATESPTYTLNNYYAVSHGVLYVNKYGNRAVYRINLSNTVDVREFTFDNLYVYSMYPMYNGGVLLWFGWAAITTSGQSTSYYSLGFLYPDGQYRYNHNATMTYTNYLHSYIGVEGDNLYMTRVENNKYLYFGYCRSYLGTICNLASPIVKTSAQSMKVTYTLTDA